MEKNQEQTQKQTQQKTEKAKQHNKSQVEVFAIISYIGVLCLVPLLMKGQNEFVKFHAKQGLVLFIAEVATMVVSSIPFLGWFLASLLWLLWVVLSIIGIVNAASGKKAELPVVGNLAGKLNF